MLEACFLLFLSVKYSVVIICNLKKKTCFLDLENVGHVCILQSGCLFLMSAAQKARHNSKQYNVYICTYLLMEWSAVQLVALI